MSKEQFSLQIKKEYLYPSYLFILALIFTGILIIQDNFFLGLLFITQAIIIYVILEIIDSEKEVKKNDN